MTAAVRPHFDGAIELLKVIEPLTDPTAHGGAEVDRGGHFAAWEQPQFLSEEIRAAFRSLR